MWFHNLCEGSVTSFAQLRKLFLGNYITNNRNKTDIEYAFDIKKIPVESLRSLVTVCRTMYRDIPTQTHDGHARVEGVPCRVHRIGRKPKRDRNQYNRHNSCEGRKCDTLTPNGRQRRNHDRRGTKKTYEGRHRERSSIVRQRRRMFQKIIWR